LRRGLHSFAASRLAQHDGESVSASRLISTRLRGLISTRFAADFKPLLAAPSIHMLFAAKYAAM
jgi:hypothetical protein